VVFNSALRVAWERYTQWQKERQTMGENVNSRLEAFCDGVFAIALTLLIIEIKVPPLENTHSSADLWRSLMHIAPSFFSFVLSFGIILITWVNHHSVLKLIHKTSAPFIYANGFLLFTVVILPFPTAMLGEYGLTEYASAAVVLYSFVNMLQAGAWILIARTGERGALTKNEKAHNVLVDTGKNGFFALIVYAVCTITAYWFPLTIAITITVIWLFWLIYGLNIKEEKI
jgi:uncharacterized membrane protein